VEVSSTSPRPKCSSDLPLSPIRSRVEIVLLWAQLILVLGDAVSLSLDAVVGDGHPLGWLFFTPMLCILPAIAALRGAHAAAVGVLGGALLSLAGFVWYMSANGGGIWHAMGTSFELTWPLFVAAGLLFAVMQTRLDREREASRLHRHTRANRRELEASEVCGCIACERIYFPSEIVQWVDDGTAVCPHCGVDAVVGSASGIPVMPGVLRRAHERWFLVG
jgi:hypothetical protein